MGEAQQYLQLTIGAVLVYNFVLARFLGICPFLGVSKRLDTALGMSGAVIFVMTLASLITSVIYNYMLKTAITVPYLNVTTDLKFLKIVLFIVVIAALVQLVEVVLQKVSPPLYSALGIYLPLITTNCAVMGVATINSKMNYNVLQSTVFGFFSAVGFALALVLFASIRERLELAQVPRPFQGMSIALITAGILAMAFIGFSGLC
ncbi:RnfABCDGE type electron transport complex subunit A [Lentisphaerota bacterium ZTH]|nr:RnfABCDGE type electron transport complex subunit A [Lentisphaerota bacterium]WET05177.1 RnfABCDGE type electron transport complex subunit A [Lentisphaerota bacterium ZTH]